MSASSLNFLWGIHCFILCYKPRVWDDIVSEDEGPRPLLVHQGWDECHGLGVLALSCLKNSTHGLKNKSVFLLQTLLYSICGNICITDLFAATFSIVTFLGTGNVTVTSVAFSASVCRLDMIILLVYMKIFLIKLIFSNFSLSVTEFTLYSIVHKSFFCASLHLLIPLFFFWGNIITNTYVVSPT